MAEKNKEPKLGNEAATAEKTKKAAAAKSEKELRKAEKAKAKAEKKAKKANSAGFLRSVIAERKKITWYAGKQSVNSTLAVLVTMIVIAAIIGGIDWVLGQGIDLISRIPELF